VSEPEIRDRPPGEIPKGWLWVSRTMPARVCQVCGRKSHYGWYRGDTRNPFLCEECGLTRQIEEEKAQAVKEEGKPKRTRRKLT